MAYMEVVVPCRHFWRSQTIYRSWFLWSAVNVMKARCRWPYWGDDV